MKRNYLVLGASVLLCLNSANSAPDPDLFDGNRSVTAITFSNGEGKNEGESASDGSNGGGSSTGSNESGDEIAESEVAREPAAIQNRDTNDARQSANGQSSTSTATSSTEPVRNFDEFEIGAIGDVKPLSETNSSKKPIEAPTSTRKPTQTANSSASTPLDPVEETSTNTQEQEQFDGNGRADYGTDVPLGL